MRKTNCTDGLKRRRRFGSRRNTSYLCTVKTAIKRAKSRMQFELFRAKAVSSEAFESYEVNALDFLLKPIRYNKFLAAVEKARKLYQQPSAPQPQQLNTLFIRVDSEWRNVPIDQITYVNGMKDYVMFYLDNEPKPLITHLTMKAVEDMLPKNKFLRIHRSYIIAVDKIQKVDRNDCVYIGKEIIHIPDGYLQTFRQFLDTRAIEKR